MMGQNRQLQKHLIVLSSDKLNELYDLVDELHNAACEDSLMEFTDTSANETVSMLQDIIYTLEETVSEIRANNRRPQPVLRIMPRS